MHPQPRQRLPHLRRRPHRPQRVILVQHRHPKHSHHRIADELLNRAAVPLHDRPHPLEIARKQGTHRFRINRLSQRGRAGHVAEQHRHRLALLTLPRLHAKRRTAMGTETEPTAALTPTTCADRHKRRLEPRLRNRNQPSQLTHRRAHLQALPSQAGISARLGTLQLPSYPKFVVIARLLQEGIEHWLAGKPSAAPVLAATAGWSRAPSPGCTQPQARGLSATNAAPTCTSRCSRSAAASSASADSGTQSEMTS